MCKTFSPKHNVLAILCNPYLMYRSHKPMVKGVHIAQSLNKYKFGTANRVEILTVSSVEGLKLGSIQ